jgi:hypothetical protein
MQTVQATVATRAGGWTRLDAVDVVEHGRDEVRVQHELLGLVAAAAAVRAAVWLAHRHVERDDGHAVVAVERRAVAASEVDRGAEAPRVDSAQRVV